MLELALNDDEMEQSEVEKVRATLSDRVNRLEIFAEFAAVEAANLRKRIGEFA